MSANRWLGTKREGTVEQEGDRGLDLSEIDPKFTHKNETDLVGLENVL